MMALDSQLYLTMIWEVFVDFAQASFTHLHNLASTILCMKVVIVVRLVPVLCTSRPMLRLL